MNNGDISPEQRAKEAEVVAALNKWIDDTVPTYVRISEQLASEPASQVVAELLKHFTGDDPKETRMLAWLSTRADGYRALRSISEHLEAAGQRHPHLQTEVARAIELLSVVTAPPGPGVEGRSGR